MQNLLATILVPLVEKLAEKIGKFILSKIKGSIEDSKRIKQYEDIKDPQARAAYAKSYLN